MQQKEDTTIRISPRMPGIVVEQTVQGVVCRKELTPETFAQCVLGSRIEDTILMSGLLPPHCVGVSMNARNTWYYIRYPDLYADFSYFGTVYEHFPLPRLLFSFRYNRESGKVHGVRMCVAEDGPLRMDTPLYHYPFSNVYGNWCVCTGNNVLPVYKDPSRLFTLAGFILRLPNNNDMFQPENNKLKLAYRDLLEYLKDREPSVYYSDVLIPSGKTAADFLNSQ